MKRYISFLTVLLVLFSCDKAWREIHVADELGAVVREHYVAADGESVKVMGYANDAGRIIPDRDAEDWITLSQTSFDKDFELTVCAGQNFGFKRRADLVIEMNDRKDTVTIFQYGTVEEKCGILAQSVVVYNDENTNTFATDISVPLESIKTEVRYPSDEEWIHDCTLSESNFSFTTDVNPDDVNSRRAYIAFEYINGWEQTEHYLVTVIQARSDNNIGTFYTAQQLRELATTEGYALPEDAIIEGIIVSDTENGQAGDLEVLDYTQGTGVINYEANNITAYMMSPDGQYGFKLIASSADENSFVRFSKVSIKASEAVVSKTLDEPVRYTIEGVSSMNILASSDPGEDLPRKVMSIGELTDDDIYTYVTLKDCEIPMRKGPFTPLNEGYTPVNSYNRFAKYPMLIRDIKGGSMYMFFNSTCPYRRDGNMMPYGSGDISGVIVHEIYKPFEKDGKIGRYQIRHFHRDEIALAEDFEDGFSALITEFRYMKKPGEFEPTELPNAILATAGNGEMCHTYGAMGNYSATYMYIGPANNKDNQYQNGAGIILDDGSSYLPVEGKESSQNTEGKCDFSADLLLSWSSKYWWDASQGQGYCYLVKFSTTGISSDKVSMQFAMHNNSQSAVSPRYWKAQYSLTTSDCSAANASQWTDIGEFTVSDVVRWNSQSDWQTAGTRVYDFPLPVEILGKESVYIRLMPRNDKAGSTSASSYDDKTIENNKGYNTMDYFAVRYNKN